MKNARFLNTMWAVMVSCKSTLPSLRYNAISYTTTSAISLCQHKNENIHHSLLYINQVNLIMGKTTEGLKITFQLTSS